MTGSLPFATGRSKSRRDECLNSLLPRPKGEKDGEELKKEILGE